MPSYKNHDQYLSVLNYIIANPHCWSWEVYEKFGRSTAHNALRCLLRRNLITADKRHTNGGWRNGNTRYYPTAAGLQDQSPGKFKDLSTRSRRPLQ